MNTIDQRILIPAPPEVVWEYISDLTNDPQWQADCRSVSFLTSKRTGPGTRWRVTTGKGREQVIEITAWYDGLGYQYTIIDGAPFRESVGRIRLQEIPEGTIVQWTFSFELGGLLGGVRASMGVSRDVDKTMVASLKSLWKQLNTTSKKMGEAKSLMRDAPNAEERSQYKPRHPSVVDIKQADQPPKAQQPIAISEPPVVEDDTRPNPVVRVPQTPAPTTQPAVNLFEDTEEPEFLADLSRFAPPPVLSDTQPVKTISPEAASQPSEAHSEVNTDELFGLEEEMPWDKPFVLEKAKPVEPITKVEDTPVETEFSESLTPATNDFSEEFTFPEVEIPSSPAVEVFTAPTPEPVVKTEPEFPPALPTTPTPAAPLQPHTDIKDTAERSIWEIFNLPRPSETQEMAAIRDSEIATAKASEPPPVVQPVITPPEPVVIAQPLVTPPEPIIAAQPVTTIPEVRRVISIDLSSDAMFSRRVGLRIRMRRSIVNLRKPN